MAAAKKIAKRKVSAKPRTKSSKTSRPLPSRPAATKTKTARKPTGKSAAAKPFVARKRKPGGSLGRVKVPVDARLDLVFQKDYQAREIFDFLKVQTIRELEQFGRDEIIERLAGPLIQTVERIRKTLAIANRHLAHDEKFAKAFLAEIKQMRTG